MDLQFRLRPVKAEDAEQLWELRRAPGFENMLAMPDERLERVKAFLAGLGPDSHEIAAVTDTPQGEKLIGLCGLTVSSNPRLRHSASLGIVVHPDYRRMGVGRALMGYALDLADNWLMLVRVELGVYPDNAKAIALYSSMGFVREGVRRKAAVRNGAYVDEVLMARIKE